MDRFFTEFNIKYISDETYLKLLTLLALPHLDSLSCVRLNEDEGVEDFKRRILYT